MILQDKLADVEFRRKEVGDKINMQSKLLQQEVKIGSLKEDTLNGVQAILSKIKLTLDFLKGKVLELEAHMKLSKIKSENNLRPKMKNTALSLPEGLWNWITYI